MGVTGLWRLIEPAGKPVPVETLENKVLAVDISIWLHQMVKGYQDAKGAPLPNAHLMGLFQRLCKLLYFRIKPIFVFDGAFPELKKETIAKRQDTKSKYNSESEQLKRQLALLLSKKTAVSSLLGKQNISPKKQQSVADSNPDDIFKLPELPQKDESESESDEESSSSSIVDLHSVDVESENFKNLSVKEKYDLLVELKETRKMNFWGRLHELPKKSDNFSDFQLQRLLKRRKVQECLEETEKEMGDAGMSLNDLETLLNEEGISTKMDSLPSRRIASNDTTRFILLKNVKQALADAKSKKEKEAKAMLAAKIEEPSSASRPTDTVDKVEQENKKDELEEDLEKAIQMSLECHTSNPNTSANSSKTDDSWTSILTNSDYSDTDSEENNGDYKMPDMSSAKAYIMQYSDFTSKAIDKIVAPKPAINKPTSVFPTADKLIEELYNEKSILIDTEKAGNGADYKEEQSMAHNAISESIQESVICLNDSSEGNVISLDCSIEDESSCNKFSKSTSEENVAKKLSVASGIKDETYCNKAQLSSSESSDGEFEEVSALEENSVKSGIEIALPIDKPLDPEEDIFSDVFTDVEIKQSLTTRLIKTEDNSGEKYLKPEIKLEVNKVEERQKVKQEVLAKLELAKKDLDNLLKSVGDNHVKNENTAGDTKVNSSFGIFDLDSFSEIEAKPTNDQELGEDQATEIVNQGLNKNVKKKNQESEVITNAIKSFNELIKKQDDANTDNQHYTITDTSILDTNMSNQDTNIGNQYTNMDNQDTNMDNQDKNMGHQNVNKYNQERNKVSDPALSTETLNSMARDLQNQEDNLLEEKGRLDRMGRNITEQMRKDAQELLQLFGIPYIVAPMEAEAQCAFLEAANLTDGTITDDSDIWLFGGRTVYKNFFNQKKHVLQYLAERIEKSFNLSREKLVLLALLVGSDYTTGVDGVGPVTALEILATFPYNSKSIHDVTKLECYNKIVAGLKEFKKWVKAGRRTDNVNLKKKLKNVKLSEDFPSVRVVQAYMEPNVEKSEERFSWGALDITVLRDYTKAKFGWSQNKLDEIIKPVLKRRQEGKTQRSVQDYFKRKIDFQSVEDQVSKRVKAAIQKMDPDGHLIEDKEQPVECKQKVVRKRKGSKKNGKEDSNLEEAGPSTSKHSKNVDILHVSNITKIETDGKDKPSDTINIAVSKTDRYQEIIPQREKDRENVLQNKMKAIEIFRKTKIEKKKKLTKKRVNLPKEKAELSESSDSN